MVGIFDVTQKVMLNESIKNLSLRPIYSYNNSQYNNSDEIIFTINQKETFSYPHDSVLQIDLEIIRPAKKAATDATVKVSLSDYAIPFLFSKITYNLNGQKIDETTNPGIAAALKNTCSIQADEKPKYSGILHYGEDGYDAELVTFNIPMKQLLGFFEDYQKCIFNVSQTLILVRSQNNRNALFHPKGTNDSGFDLKVKAVTWMVPFLEPHESIRLNLMRIIERNQILQIPFRNWSIYSYPTIPSQTKSLVWPLKTSTSLERPRYIIIGFQTARENNINKNMGAFDHCNIKDVCVYLGSDRYPYSAYNCDFSKKIHISPLYSEFTKFQENYYGAHRGSPMIDLDTFTSKYPIWVISCQHQPEAAVSSTIDIKIMIEAHENIPDNTSCHCLILSDRLVELSIFSGIVKSIV